jgi:hypothetical protein
MYCPVGTAGLLAHSGVLSAEGPRMYFCERDYEPSDRTQDREFSDWLLKNKSA